MTREEAIIALCTHKNVLEKYIDYEGWPEVTEAIEVVCEELKQKPTIEVLQEIRQEIKIKQTDTEYLQGICPFGPCGEWYDGVDDGLKIVLNIIDGHMEETDHDQ